MTDLTKLSVAELREQAKNIITSLNAFDELADRYRRLIAVHFSSEEAQGAIAVSEEDKELLSKCEFIFRMGDFHSRCYAIAVALKRRIEGEGCGAGGVC